MIFNKCGISKLVVRGNLIFCLDNSFILNEILDLYFNNYSLCNIKDLNMKVILRVKNIL